MVDAFMKIEEQMRTVAFHFADFDEERVMLSAT
jgi:hypothetical protein